MDNATPNPHYGIVTYSHDIIIIGGGLVGGLAAATLAAHGFHTALLDAMPPPPARPKFDGRAYMLSAASSNLLRALNLWSGLEKQAVALSAVEIDDRAPNPGAALLHFDAPSRSPMGYIVEDRHLRIATMRALKASPNLDLHHKQLIKNIDFQPNYGIAMGQDGQKFTAPLLIACDGRNSQTARNAGIDYVSRPYHQQGIVAAIKHEKPHDNIAYQLFRPGGPIAFLPLTGDKSSIVWSEKTARADDIHALPDADFMALLQHETQGKFGTISLAGPRFSFPLSLSLPYQMHAPRLALIGDAAHAIHPLAGQGMNLGIKDVACLCELLVMGRRRGEDIGSSLLLARYSAWRRPDNLAMSGFTDSINRLFSNHNPAAAWLRQRGSKFFATLPGAMRRATNVAAGQQQGAPALLEGRAL